MSTLRSGWLCLLGLVTVCLAGPAAAEPVPLTPQDAVRRALRENLGLRLDRLDPDLTNLSELLAQAAFRPQLFASADVVGSPGSTSSAGEPTRSTSVGGEVGVRQTFSTGTSLEGRLSSQGTWGGGRGGLDPAYETGLTLQARQALLQGVSRAANELSLRTARLQREAAQALLRRKAELVATSTLKAYWDLRAAVAKLEIERTALRMTEKTLQETESLIGAGKLAPSEKASSAYTVQVQRRAVLQAEQSLDNARDRMARLIGVVQPHSLDTPELVPTSAPRRTPPQWSLPELQKQALAHRGDYRSLLISIQIRKLEEGAARHKLLPRLDLVGGLQLSGFAGDPAAGTTSSYSGGYWSSWAMKRVGWNAGLSLEVPLGNLEARTRRDLAALQVRRAELSEQIAIQDLSLELNLSWRALQLARRQLQLTTEAATLAEVKLQNESERYKAGKITAHILSTVQLETIQERLSREEALATLVKSVIDMQAASGSLLGRLGLTADGEAAK
jgi:outer membrane protein TolC